MKRFHVHLGVENLDRSIGSSSDLFGAGPSVRKDDYAKWMLDNRPIVTDRAMGGANPPAAPADRRRAPPVR